MRRVNVSFDVELNLRDFGDINAEVVLSGYYSRPSLHDPGEMPEVKIESLTLYDDDGEPYDGDLALLKEKVSSHFTLEETIAEKAIEKWFDMDDCE